MEREAPDKGRTAPAFPFWSAAMPFWMAAAYLGYTSIDVIENLRRRTGICLRHD